MPGCWVVLWTSVPKVRKGDHLQTVKLLAVGLDIEVEDLIVLDDPKEEEILKLKHGKIPLTEKTFFYVFYMECCY